MRNTIRFILSFVVLAAFHAGADEPPPAAAAPAAPAAVSAPAAAVTSATTTAPAAASTSAADAAKADLEQQNKRMRGLGYKPEVQRDGTTLYCKREAQLGSHFETKNCSTAQQIDARTAESKFQTEHIQRNSTTLPATK